MVVNTLSLEFELTIMLIFITLYAILVSLQMLTFLFGDNLLVVNSTVMNTGNLQRCYRIIKYQRTRETQAKVIIKFVHINVYENPADIVTRICASNTWFSLMKSLIFWRGMDFLRYLVVAKGSKNRF